MTDDEVDAELVSRYGKTSWELSDEAEAGYDVSKMKQRRPQPRWRIHWCLADSYCREFRNVMPPRLHFHTPYGSLVCCLPPLYRTLDMESCHPCAEDETPVLTGKKTWAWEGIHWWKPKR